MGTLGLLADRDFRRFWVGQTISVFGSSVSEFALPLTAILVLGASAWQMGLLQAAAGIPYLLASLPVGVAVDRVRRRSLMVATDVARACVIGAVPVLAMSHHLNFADLAASVLLVGLLSVTFDTSYEAFVPTLVGRERLIQANGAMQFSQSLAAMGGPGTAGLLISLLTAPATLLIDAASFLVSAVSLAAINRAEPIRKTTGHPAVFADLREGLRFLFAHPVLRPLTLAGTGIWFSGFLAVYYLYLNRVEHLPPFVMGLILSAGAVGAAVGSMVTARLTARLGYGRTVAACQAGFALAAWMVPLAGGPRALVVATLIAAAVLAFFCGYTGSVTSTTIRQALTPDHLLGRVASGAQIVSAGLAPVGALLGGILGQTAGLRPTLLAASAGLTLMALWLWVSPVRGVRRIDLTPSPP